MAPVHWAQLERQLRDSTQQCRADYVQLCCPLPRPRGQLLPQSRSVASCKALRWPLLDVSSMKRGAGALVLARASSPCYFPQLLHKDSKLVLGTALGPSTCPVHLWQRNKEPESGVVRGTAFGKELMVQGHPASPPELEA